MACWLEPSWHPPPLRRLERNAALAANLKDGVVGGVPRADLNSEAARIRAYAALTAAGLAPAYVPQADQQTATNNHVFYEQYSEPSAEVTTAAAQALKDIETAVFLNQIADLALDAISLASIYFLAAMVLPSPLASWASSTWRMANSS